MRHGRFTTGALVVGVLALTACSGGGSGVAEPGASPAGDSAASGECEYSYGSDQEGLEEIEGVQLGSTPVPDGGGERVAVILKALTNQYWQGIERGARAAAEDLGVEITLQAASSEAAHTEQLTIAQTIVNQQYDAYVIAPETTSNLQPALEQMQEQCAPVVNVDDARVAATVYVGPDHELNGIAAADLFAELYPDGAEVAQVEGQAGSSAAILRIKGYTEGIESHDGLELVASVPGNWDGNEAFAAAQQVMQQNPDLRAIYANNDTMAVGVVEAVRGAGKIGEIAVVGTDGVPEAISLVRTGDLAATVSPLPFYEGYWAVEAAVRLLRGEQVAPWVVAPAQLITAENVDEYFDDQGQVRAGLFD